MLPSNIEDDPKFACYYFICFYSSAGASSPAVPSNFGGADWLGHGPGSKTGSQSWVGTQPPRASLSTSAGGSALGSSQPSCRPWERGDLLRRLATFKPGNWLGKPKVRVLYYFEFMLGVSDSYLFPIVHFI